MIRLKGNRQLSFFAHMEIVPKTTAQQKKFNTRTKTFYKTGNIKMSEALLAQALSGRQPKEPFNVPIKLTVYWIFPPTKKSKLAEVKGTRPDLDNLQKLLQDMLCKMNFYTDDSLIVDLHVKKVWHKKSGLYIKIEEANTIDKEILEMLKE